MTTTARLSERAPQQDRSRQSWERVLGVGMELFEERGWSGLTITEVCRRAKVSAPSIYARVDGKAGLFRAVHERWLVQIRRTEDELVAEHVDDSAAVEQAAQAAARVVVATFSRHSGALRALIDRSVHDEELLARGSTASRALIGRLAESIPVPLVTAESAVRAVYAECVLRSMFGNAFLGPADESAEAFELRVVTLAQTICAGQPVTD